MSRNSWIVLCLAYIIGLFLANWLTSNGELTLLIWCLLLLGLGGASWVSAIAWGNKFRLDTRIWLGVVVIAIFGVGYFSWRLPHPTPQDISHQVAADGGEVVTVTGKVINEPRLNANNRLKLILNTSQLGDRKTVAGKLYVTLPLLSGTGINPGEEITLQGILYLPQAATNAGGFDFRQYLARQGIFAGMQGLRVTSDLSSEPAWGWWKLRRRIVRSYLRGLGSPLGQLVGSMVLGRKAVDLPPELRDSFIEAGLAHVLAASGFHVSLLLGLILKLTTRFAPQPRLAIGIGTLMVYLGLTGIQASVLRACLMGSAVLFALTKETKVKPLGLLLLVGTVILLFNPLLIGDLGFQLSFLATFGLIVTLPGLQDRMDWLPPTIATLIAVPLAASLWVLPLLSFVFHRVATYNIIVNIICTPLVMVVSLGGMISAMIALIFPLGGSAIAWLLFYPTSLLVSLVNWFTNLPGSTWVTGQIAAVILLGIYGLLVLTWLHQWWRKRWWLGLLLMVMGILTPAIDSGSRLQISLLSAQPAQIIVIQDRQEAILINSGSQNQAKYIVLPFLARQGINQIDYGLALDAAANSPANWLEIDRLATVKSFVSLIGNVPQLFSITRRTTPPDAITTNSLRLHWNRELAVIYLQIKNHTWLILGQSDLASDRQKAQIQQYIQQHDLQSQPPIVVWSGNQVPVTWLQLLKPQIAIASSSQIEPSLVQKLSHQSIQLYNTEAGTINWNLQDRLLNQQLELN